MHKNLNPQAMGLSGRQSELVELALSHGYDSLSLDMEDLFVKAEKKGVDSAARYLASGQIKAGPFRLPVAWQEDDARFEKELARLEKIAPIAKELGATSTWTTVMAASDSLPYRENFEFHRARFTAIADVLAPHDMWLGLTFQAAPQHRANKAHQFITSPDALVTLMKTVGVKNVGIVVDLWNWRVGGGALDHLREISAEQIVNVQVADVPSDKLPEEISDRDRAMPSAESEFLVQAIQLLIELGYDGVLTPTPSPSRMPRQTRDARAAAASRALEILCRLARNEEIPPEIDSRGEMSDDDIDSDDDDSDDSEVAEDENAEETVEAS